MQVLQGLTVDPTTPFVDTPYFKRVIEQGLAYLQASIPVHLQGPAGVGKTTCALHLGHRLGRPVVLMFGSDEAAAEDFLGHHFGYRRRTVVDQYIHSVERREEQVSARWVDGRLLAACKEGYTLIYDEFSRSRPETNNLLLSVLEEGVLELPPTYEGEKYIKVHPDFRAIFTSNPEEFSGIHQRPNALLDRMITIDLRTMDAASEVAIIAGRTGLDEKQARIVVEVVRRVRKEQGKGPSLRPALMIARVLQHTEQEAAPGTPVFDQLCEDVLGQAPPGPVRTKPERKGE
jgi:nitric oxide reductase NorQ protein